LAAPPISSTDASAGGLDFGDAPEGQRLRAIHAYW
jgi:hypothetical protein